MENNYQVAEQNERSQTVDYIKPRASLSTDPNGYTLRIEMPGVGSNGVDVSVEDNELRVIGHRNSSTLPGEPVYTESGRSDYRRVFELDPSLDTNKIEAKIEHGILTLKLHKAEDRKPRKIQVQD